MDEREMARRRGRGEKKERDRTIVASEGRPPTGPMVFCELLLNSASYPNSFSGG